MENLRTIRDLNQQVQDLQNRQNSTSFFGGASFTSQAEIDRARLDLEDEKAAAAQKKAQMANDFGVPQELLDFLKQKVTDKESEGKKLEQALKERNNTVASLEEQLANFETVSNQKI